jgi:hypothetical protein
MLGSVIKNVWPKAEGYNYMQDAVAWVKVNNPNNEPVFYNEGRLKYYAGASFDFKNRNSVNEDKFINYKFLIIKASKKQKNEMSLKKIKGFKLVKTFEYQAQKKFVLIFKSTQKEV